MQQQLMRGLAPPCGAVRLRTTRHRPAACARAARCALASAALTADRKFRLPDEAEVHLFGVEHLSSRPEVGDFILSTRPASVVFETACTEGHGERHNTRLTGFELVESPVDWHKTMLNISQHIKLQAMNTSDLKAIELWQQVRVAAPTEQVAYVAALAVEAPLVFGDRPKDVTFRRLLTNSSAAELDAAFGAQAASNYASLVGGDDAAEGDDVFERVAVRERDAFLYHALRTEARAAGVGKTVVGVVGAAHVSALAAMFASRRELPDLAPLLATPAFGGAGADDAQLGVRRAILERLLALRCPPEVAEEAVSVLGELPAEQHASYEQASELYGNCRMLLAMLDREQLAQVACGARGVDLYELLAPLRALRPANGGAGTSEAVLEQLRNLALQL